jgi:hypothetical protein
MDNTNIPSIIFIIPYRNRENHLLFFRRYIQYLLEDYDPTSYEIFFIHQRDNRSFNRGAMKNIGFIAMKNKYPNHYKNITFVFNDIDTLPFKKNILPYKTGPGIIKHFYGFQFTLGGIVSITGGDFETLNGFPNFWSWGYEDNELQRRALANSITIDRSIYFPIFDDNIIQFHHGLLREVNPVEKKRYTLNTTEGIVDIQHLQYTVEKDMIHVDHFTTGVIPTPNITYSITSGEPLKHIKRKMSMRIN